VGGTDFVRDVQLGSLQTEREVDDGEQNDRREHGKVGRSAAHLQTAHQPVMPNSHRPPDTTRQSCLCRVWRGGVNWTIAINVFRLQIFCRRQSWVVGNPIHTAEADATQTRQFCRV